MANDNNRFWIDTEGVDRQALVRGIKWLDRCLARGERGLVAVPRRGTVEGFVASAIGSRFADQFRLRDGLGLPGGGRAQLLTQRGRRPAGWRAGPVLAVHPSEKLLDRQAGEGPSA